MISTAKQHFSYLFTKSAKVAKTLSKNVDKAKVSPVIQNQRGRVVLPTKLKNTKHETMMKILKNRQAVFKKPSKINACFKNFKGYFPYLFRRIKLVAFYIYMLVDSNDGEFSIFLELG